MLLTSLREVTKLTCMNTETVSEALRKLCHQDGPTTTVKVEESSPVGDEQFVYAGVKGRSRLAA